jgi:hypothetical protein
MVNEGTGARPAEDSFRRGWLLPVLLLPALLALPFAAGQVLLYRDLFHFTAPEELFGARALLAGRLPLWNPMVYGGTPYLASTSPGVFFPLNWLFLLLPPLQAGTAAVLLLLPVAAAGSYRLARTLGGSRAAATLAACGYTTSGYLLSMHGGHLYFASAALLPLAVDLLLRAARGAEARALVPAAAAVALLLFNGEFQALLFAAQLLPSLLFARTTTRASATPLAQ